MLSANGVFTALQLVTVVITTSNEVCLPFNQWIISPSKPPSAQLESIFPWTVTTALSYAIAEPIAYVGLSVLPIPPTLVILVLGILFMAIQPFCVHMLNIQVLLEVVARRKAVQDKTQSSLHSKAEPPSGAIPEDSPPPASRVQINAALLVPAVMLAVFNAAFLLFRQYLVATSLDGYGWAWGPMVIWGTVLFQYLALMMDSSIPKDSYKARFVGRAGPSVLRVQLGHLALLLACRAASRKLLGIQPFLGLNSAYDARLTNELIERESYSRFSSFFEAYVRAGWYKVTGGNLPTWVMIIAPLLCGVPIFLSGFRDLFAAQRDWANEYADVANKHLGRPGETSHVEA